MIITPLIVAVIVDEVFTNQTMAPFLPLVLIYALLFAQGQLFFLFDLIVWQYICNTSLLRIKHKIYSNILYAKAKFMADSNIGNLMTVINDDVDNFISIINQNMLRFTNSFLSFIFGMTVVFLINYKIALLLLVSSALSIATARYTGHFIGRIAARNRDKYGNYISFIYELFKGIREVRLLGSKRQITKMFLRYNKSMIINDAEISKIQFIGSTANDAINLIFQLGIYILCAFLIHNKQITLGMFFAIVSYYTYIKDSINDIINLYIEFKRRKVSITKVKEMLEIESEAENNNLKDLKVLCGNIEFRDIHFAYEKEKPVLQGVNLEINSGEVISIVGESGEGKSTLIYLLLGFYSPQNGEIKIDGQSVSEFSTKSLRRNVGVVQQEIMLFDGSIRYNMQLAKADASDEEIWDALKKADISDFVEGLPDRLDTLLGSGGQGVSGGQRQRLAIARVFLKNPSILILDEVTSSLDNESEKAINEAVSKLSRNRTTIIIAHKLSTVINSSRVAVLHKGRVVSFAHHTRLIEICPIYKKLFGEQYSKMKEGALNECV
jgi:ABC-type multidrug transport system fused ATPase/permease subunit